LGVRQRVARSRELVAAGYKPTVVARVAQITRHVGSGNAAELATYFVEKGKPFLVVVE
jgi:hypothetical protein